MAFISPYITDKYVAYLGEVRSTGLSLAVRIIDDYTGKEPIGNIKVLIKEGNKKAIKNPSGYYLFNDLAGGNYTVSMESDYYFPEERTVDTSKIHTSDITLEFDNSGPPAKATNTQLKAVSKLQDGDVVEFYNSGGQIEQRSITDIDVNNRTISWTRELKYDFSKKGSNVKVLKYIILEILLKPRSSYPFPGYATLVRGLVLNNHPVPDAIVKDVANSIRTKTDKNGEFVLFYKGIEDGTSIDIDIIKNSDSKHLTDIIITPEKTLFLSKILFS